MTPKEELDVTMWAGATVALILVIIILSRLFA